MTLAKHSTNILLISFFFFLWRVQKCWSYYVYSGFRIWAHQFKAAGTIQVVRLSSYLIVRALILIKLIWRFSETQIIHTSSCLLVRASIFLIAGLEFFKFDIQGFLHLRLSIRHCVWLSGHQSWLNLIFLCNSYYPYIIVSNCQGIIWYVSPDTDGLF